MKRTATLVMNVAVVEAWGAAAGDGRAEEEAGPEGAVRAAGVEGDKAARKNRVQTARKFWSACPRKLAAACTRFPKSRRSIKFTTASQKSYARSTALATRRTSAISRPATTRFN